MGGVRGVSCVGARLDDPAVEIEVSVEYCACACRERAGEAGGEGGWGGSDGLDAGAKGEGGGRGRVGFKSDGKCEVEWKRGDRWVERSVGAQLRDCVGERLRGGGLGAGEKQGDGECECETHWTLKIRRVDGVKTVPYLE